MFIFFVIYFLSWVVAFKVFGLHVSKLGDALKYGRGIIIYVLDEQALTTNIFTVFSYIGLSPLILGLIFAYYISHFMVNNLVLNKSNIFILLCIINPFVIQYLIYPSKEFLLACGTVLIYKFRNHTLLCTIFSILTFLIRPTYFIAVVVFFIIYKKGLFGIGIKAYSILIAVFTLLGLLYLENSGQVESLFIYIENLFLPYKAANTNRFWLPSVTTIFSYEFIIWISVGFYTIFFGFLFDAPNIIIRFLVIIAGIGKILLIYKICKIRLVYGYLWFSAFVIYGLPLSIVNVGSSMRYTIPITIIMLYSYTIMRKEIIDERR
mgnify:CR=1 FL=1